MHEQEDSTRGFRILIDLSQKLHEFPAEDVYNEVAIKKKGTVKNHEF